MNNQAFVDGQNLHLGTTRASSSWKVDLKRFRVYLREKYHVETAYYFLGAVNDEYQDLYKSIRSAGFILVFREHHQSMIGTKKGNVDTDIVFKIMEKIAEKEQFDKVVLVSGDGDYIKMVRYLIKKDRLEKVLAPSRQSISSLYKHFIDNRYYVFLDDDGIKRKIIAGSP